MVETVSPAENFAKDHIPGQLIKEQDKLRNLLESNRHVTSSKNLYEHVIDVMDFLVVNYPFEALEKFEEVSYLIKQGSIEKLEKFLCTEDRRNYAKHCDESAKVTGQYIDRANVFFQVIQNLITSYRHPPLKLTPRQKKQLGLSHPLVSFPIFALRTNLYGSGLELTWVSTTACFSKSLSASWLPLPPPLTSVSGVKSAELSAITTSRKVLLRLLVKQKKSLLLIKNLVALPVSINLATGFATQLTRTSGLLSLISALLT
jgi:hypothetical protein